MSGPFFHGGVAGLVPGDRILPRTETGMPLEPQGAFVRDHNGCVHVTTDRSFASLFAAGAPGGGKGDLYEVDVDGPLEADPDTQFGSCFLAAAATVTDVVARGIEAPDAPYRSDFWQLVLGALRERRPARVEAAA